MQAIESLKSAAATLKANVATAQSAYDAAAKEYNDMRLYPRGLRVVVTKGRKFPKGNVATVQKCGENGYGRWCFILCDDQSEGFIALDNLTICDDQFAMATQRLDNATALLRDAEHDLRWAQAEYKAAVVGKAGIDLAVRIDPKLEQAAWRDYERFLTPCNAAASDAEINDALRLLDPMGNSWGALRWSCGTQMIERVAPDMVRVERTVGIAD